MRVCVLVCVRRRVVRPWVSVFVYLCLFCFVFMFVFALVCLCVVLSSRPQDVLVEEGRDEVEKQIEVLPLGALVSQNHCKRGECPKLSVEACQLFQFVKEMPSLIRILSDPDTSAHAGWAEMYDGRFIPALKHALEARILRG